MLMPNGYRVNSMALDDMQTVQYGTIFKVLSILLKYNNALGGKN